ncbi:MULTISPECIES: RNA 2'-phosphotransferase [Lysinibacillus]|uniref:Probable RNA 2'-phosphotransferase n=1 Tax=Lysinibacillus irui TaxID=2998077 RepID=A0AAJ5RGD3_9BACI|nr:MULTISPECIES: RNA 2'-phosphotransferase [Lysinibacillus]WDV05492.1 RNA 2'-phosphotransferase [Lysinibacillus irui]
MNEQEYYIELSKEISYALRHVPWKYELELDEEGWVPVDQLLSVLNQSKKWVNTTLEDVQQMILLSKKKRHELLGNKIRALYGHSTHNKIIKKEVVPPKRLFHGTSPEFMSFINEKGLLPMSRQYVHLSEDIETAHMVGKRKAFEPIILIVNTEESRKKGIKFYLGNEKVWLSDYIPIEFISVKK